MIIKNRLNKKVLYPIIAIILLLSFFIIPSKNNKSIFSNLITIHNKHDELSAERLAVYDKMRIEYVNIKNRVTGTEPFNDGDTSNSEGVDVSETDDYIRTFDIMKYTVEIGIEPNTDHEGVTSTSTFEGGVIKVRAKLPNQGTPTLITWESDAWMKNVSCSEDRTEIYAEYHVPEGTIITNANQSLSFTVKVDGYKKEVTDEMAPEFEFWMEGNKPDDPTSLAESVAQKDNRDIIISGKANIDVALVRHNRRLFRGIKDGVTGEYMNFGYSVAIIQPNPNFSDLRGVEFPDGDVEITLKSTYSYRNRDSSDDWTEIADPSYTNVLAYGINGEAKPGYYFRDHKTMYGLSCGRLGLFSKDKYCVFDSGIFSLDFDNNYYHLKFSDYKLDSTKFPLRYIGASSDTTNFSRGRILTGNSQIFIPYYDFDSNISYDYEYSIEVDTVKYKDINGNTYTVNGADETKVTDNVATNTFSKSLQGSVASLVRIYSGNTHANEESSAVIGSVINPTFEVETTDGPYAGGIISYITWNSNYVTFANVINTFCESTMDFDCPTFEGVIYQYGILKSDPNNGLTNIADINSSSAADFDWYNTTDEALTHGKIAAIRVDDPIPTELGVKRGLKPRFIIDDNEDNIGKVAAFYQKASVFEDVERTKEIKINEAATFKEAQYNPDGTLKRSSSPRAIGASLLVLGARARTDTSVLDLDSTGNKKQSYDVQDNEVNIIVTPNLSNDRTPTEDDITANNVIVQTILPEGLTYKTASANKEPSNIIVNPNGTTTIEWEYVDWQINRPAPDYPDLIFKAEINASLSNNASLLIKSTIYTDLDLSDDSRLESKYKHSEYGIIISNLAGSKTLKNIDNQIIDKNESFSITSTLGNNSDDELINVRTIEILPYNNDNNGSKYHGSYNGKITSGITNQRFFYTTGDISNIGLTTDRNGKITIKDVDLPNDSRWIELNIGDNIPNNATALATMLPSIAPLNEKSYTLQFTTTNNQKNDIYAFTHNMTSDNLEVAVKSNTVIAEVVERKISGIAFLDKDRDNLYNNLDSLLTNNTVELLDLDGNKIAETTTNDDGYYSFSLPDKGNYYVKFRELFGYELVPKGTSDISSKVNSNYRTDIINHIEDPESVIFNKENYNVGFRKKAASLTVHHYIKDTTNSLSPDEVSTVYYTDAYETNKLNPIPTNYRFSSNSGDDPTGIVDKDNIVVNYFYELKPATLKVLYIDESNNNIDPTKNINDNTKHWGDSYSTIELDFPNYELLRTEGDQTSGTINKDTIEVKYIYRLKPATLKVLYVDESNNNIDSTKNINDNTKHWGDSYSSEELVFPNYSFVRVEGDPVSGTINKDTIEVKYIYELNSSIVRTKYLDQEGNQIISDVVLPTNWGLSYNTEQKEFPNYDFVNHEGDPISGTVDKNEIIVIYKYKLKRGSVITHHYLYENGIETTTELSPDVTDSYDYTNDYTTKESDKISENYELYRKTNNYKGTVSAPIIHVYYYYQLKDSSLETIISKNGTELITRKDENVEYHINYTAKVKDYIGDATITLVEHLPHPIDIAKSELDGGNYDSTTKTITWIIPWNDINTYEGNDKISLKNVKKDLTLVYEGIVGRDRLITSSTNAKIELSNNTRNNEAIVATNIRIPGIIIVKYMDENGNEIEKPVAEENLVGESTITKPIEKEGYRLVEIPPTENYEFEEERQIVIYKYERIVFDIKTEVDGEGGTIEGNESVSYGESSTKEKIVINATNGFVINKIIVDGKEIEVKPNQKKMVLNNFVDVKENHFVKVSFIPYNPDTYSNIKDIIIIAMLISFVVFAVSINIKSQRLKKR